MDTPLQVLHFAVLGQAMRFLCPQPRPNLAALTLSDNGCSTGGEYKARAMFAVWSWVSSPDCPARFAWGVLGLCASGCSLQQMT